MTQQMLDISDDPDWPFLTSVRSDGSPFTPGQVARAKAEIRHLRMYQRAEREAPQAVVEPVEPVVASISALAAARSLCPI
jgi:hypothetical protein